MQNYSGQAAYLCPYFTCTSPYCIAIRPNVIPASSLAVNRSSSTSSSAGSSFSISSILSRSDESSPKDSTNDLPSPAKPEASASLGSYQPSHFSLDRFHPYHRSLGVSAFARAGSCGTIHKGEKSDTNKNIEKCCNGASRVPFLMRKCPTITVL